MSNFARIMFLGNVVVVVATGKRTIHVDRYRLSRLQLCRSDLLVCVRHPRPASVAEESTLVAGAMVRDGLRPLWRLRSDRSVDPHLLAALVESNQSRRTLSVAEFRHETVLSRCQSLLTPPVHRGAKYSTFSRRLLAFKGLSPPCSNATPYRVRTSLHSHRSELCASAHWGSQCPG